MVIVSLGQTTQINNNTTESTSELFLRYVIIILPISISILIASSTYFKYGNKWVMLRNAAEEVKSEIYQYRTRVGNYKENKDSSNDPTKTFKTRRKTISTNRNNK